MSNPLRFALPVLVSLAMTSAPAMGQSALQSDISRATCAQYQTSGAADRDQVALWLYGFFAGAAQRPVIDVQRFRQGAAGLAALCNRDPGVRLLGQEVRALFLP